MAATIASMPDDRTARALRNIQETIAAAFAGTCWTDPVSAYRDQLRGWLEAARACGEIHDYADSYLYDPETETLYADLKIMLEAPPGYIDISFSQPPADTIEE